LSLQNHFWAGSGCLAQDPNPTYPRDVIAISDILTIKADLGNQVPKNSWMIYLFEQFIDNGRHVPLELDLFCDFNGKNNFEAVFNGNNQYPFQKVLPQIGHSYQREIILDTSKRIVIYRLHDLNSGESESFPLSANNMNGKSDQKQELIEVINGVNFQPYKHFTGIEWWNKAGNVPFPVRYHVQVSMLRYAQAFDSSPDLEKLNYKPYTSLAPDNDTLGNQYPILFQNLQKMDGCICYDVKLGTTNTGMTFTL
jgi:hypothetical protein